VGTGLTTVASMPATASPKKPPPATCTAWQDYFINSVLDPTRWVIASGQAPGYIPGYHIGYYVPSMSVSGAGILP
jgi:hypothetical protein